MRYRPPRQNVSDVNAHFAVMSRPPHSELPTEIATLLDDRDRLAGEYAAQYADCQRLKDPTLDNQARIDDDRLAGQALRAGKPLPDPTAAPALAQQRRTADRRLGALADAQEQVRFEILALGDVERDTMAAKLPKVNAAARAKADALVAQLVAVIEENAHLRALHDWYAGHDYHPRPLVAADELPDPRTTNRPIDVGHAVAELVNAVLEDTDA